MTAVAGSPGFADKALPIAEIKILNAEEVCEGELELFTDAPQEEETKCDECDRKFNEAEIENQEKRSKCNDDAGTDFEKLQQCLDKFDEERQKASDEFDKCTSENSCAP